MQTQSSTLIYLSSRRSAWWHPVLLLMFLTMSMIGYETRLDRALSAMKIWNCSFWCHPYVVVICGVTRCGPHPPHSPSDATDSPYMSKIVKTKNFGN